MNKQNIITALLAIISFSLASCGSDDDNEDKVEQVMIYVSAETGAYQNVPDNNYVEGMLIKENGATSTRKRLLPTPTASQASPRLFSSTPTEPSSPVVFVATRLKVNWLQSLSKREPTTAASLGSQTLHKAKNERES